MTARRKEPERLPHGYTNATSLQSRHVIKRYLGPDAVMRRENEIKALTFLVGRIPVPALLEQNESSIMLSFVPGVPGQEILEQRPDDVLFAVGRAGRALHELDVSAAYEIADGSVLLHGDFGPQNMLFDWALDFVSRWQAVGAASITMWQQRLDATSRFHE